MSPEGATFSGGRVLSGDRSEALTDLAGAEGVEAKGEIKPAR